MRAVAHRGDPLVLAPPPVTGCVTGYNIFGVPLAAGLLARWGLVLSPAVGAVLMSARTVIVALNARLLRRARLR